MFQNSNTNGLAFALPGRWTGGKREVRWCDDTRKYLVSNVTELLLFCQQLQYFVVQEEEMRRLVAAQRELCGGETSQSDWSEEDNDEEAADENDHLSMAANGELIN